MSEGGTYRGSTAVDSVASGLLGDRVRGLRRERGLTLEELAGRSGVSRAMISKVERGEKNPTLVVAAKLAEGLGVSLPRLAGVEERSSRVIVVRREERPVARDPRTGFERQLLSPGLGGRSAVEFVRNVIPEGSASGEALHSGGVEEFVAVEKGRLRAVLGGEEYLLEEGDALYFEADVVHRFDNAGDGECSYYQVIAPAGREPAPPWGDRAY